MNKVRAVALKQKGFVPILIVIILATAVLGGYLVYQNQPKPTPSPEPSPLSTEAPAKVEDPTANWKTYTDSTFGYSFKYPADYKPYFKDGNAFYSSDAKFDKTTTAKTHGIEIGSLVYSLGEDKQDYIGPNTKIDSSLTSKMVLPQGAVTKAFVNMEDVTVTIDYKKDNKNMRIMIWCGGENGNSSGCKNVLIPLLSTFKFTQ